ncbi:hypothetical protein ACFQ05_26125 [Amycolatopsis umgeniensis]|uniref:Uncharacterized protein n=1 Tax=Amycolatopsis umgeniensis TaxID=336628 RepID=A0A841BAM5_9PSEU|nr:hypothetical protein [Amycolatopsis umgeniensis]MBB5856357.1 hypothetical protein [Amycolatopsis umgeniensis]
MKERARLEKRLARLKATEQEVADRTAFLAGQVTKRAFTVVTIRNEFVRLGHRPRSDASDRRAPERADRPPATRLISPRGISLRLYLTALFLAQGQERNRAGTLPDNLLPVTPPTLTTPSWIDTFASDAKSAGAGRSYMSARAKKVRQLKSTLDVLAAEGLVRLPYQGRTSGKHERFELLHERGQIEQGENEQYRLPRSKDTTFSLPAAFFKQGWIHVLEDSEIAFLLMIASLGAEKHQVAIEAEIRLLNYGISRTTYTANRMLERLGLITVDEDDRRTADGKISGFQQGMDIMLDRFQLKSDGFDSVAYGKLRDQIEYQLDRLESYRINDEPGPVR